ncbi:hypothetical protein BN3659_01039 [Alistipes sp. CHKCI003]|nr:hypothetical protein BN3659_01039 [Alistipes sp. CHKCI003]
MKEFQIIEVNSLRLRLYGKVWRFCYRLRTKIRRIQSKAVYNALRTENRPRLYRIKIR